MKDELLLKRVNGKVKLNGNGNGHSHDFNNGHDIIGENHIATSIDTPIRKDAFDISDDRKMEVIAEKFSDILETMGLDLTDDSLQGTPCRVAKMFVKKIFHGLNPANKPVASVFENKFKYSEMLRRIFEISGFITAFSITGKFNF